MGWASATMTTFISSGAHTPYVPTNPATRNIEKHKLQARLFINVTLGQWNSSSVSKVEANVHHMPHYKLSCASADSVIFLHSSCECACMIIVYKMKENKCCLSSLETLERQKGKKIHMPYASMQCYLKVQKCKDYGRTASAQWLLQYLYVFHLVRKKYLTPIIIAHRCALWEIYSSLW